MTLNILLIDDDHSFRRIVELRLRSFFNEPQVFQVSSLTEAREFLNKSEKPVLDLVMLDEHLPDGRGADFLKEGHFQDLAVLSVSSDDAPEIPGKSLQAGATYFLSKVHVSQPLFRPLVEGVIERNRLQRALSKAHLDAAIINTVRTLVSTLQHEINNPLGAVLGAAYILRNNQAATPEQREAAELVESSGQRIKHVLEQLVKAVSLEALTKANQKVFHIPGDKPWESS